MLTDASPFSRALWYIDVNRVKKLVEKKDKIIVGRATNLDGYLVEVDSDNVLPSRTKLDNGKEVELVQKGEIFSKYRVAPGVTFRKLLEELRKDEVYPVLLPTYLEGTVGGFVAINGSGIGSYKFGFVKGKKEVHAFDGESVIITAARYEKLLVLDKEFQLAWTAELMDGKMVYYVPDVYEEMVGKDYVDRVNTYDYISRVSSHVTSFLKQGNIVVGARVSNLDLVDALIRQLKPDGYYGYFIKYNAPNSELGLILSISRDKLDDYFEFLKKNKGIMPYLSLRDYSKIHSEILKEFKRKEVRVPKEYKEYSNLYLQASACVNCGLCVDSCKAFQVTGNILYSPPGKYGRLVIAPESLEACFGCELETSKCPVGINIGEVNIEFINKISKNKLNLNIELLPLPHDLKELEGEINRKYANRSLSLLFVGCAYKYDPKGVDTAIRFLYYRGDEIKEPFTPRVKIIDGKCCGFSDYINGNITAAKAAVDSIERERILSNAAAVYFFCPEGLYVYRKLGGKNGYLLYDAIKDLINVDRNKLTIGCWGKKVGLDGEIRECAGLSATNYRLSPMMPEHKDYVTICPFATWKFVTISVYSMLPTEGVVQPSAISEVAERKAVDVVNKLVEEFVKSFSESVIAAADVIAEKVPLIQSGGYDFFTSVIRLLFSNSLIKATSKNLTSKGQNSDVVSYVKSIINDRATLRSVVSLIISALQALNVKDLAVRLQKAILISPRLDYNFRPYVESDNMVSSLEKAIRNSVSPELVERVLKEIALS